VKLKKQLPLLRIIVSSAFWQTLEALVAQGAAQRACGADVIVH